MRQGEEHEENKAFPRTHMHDAADVGVNMSEKPQKFEKSEVYWQGQRPDIKAKVFHAKRDFKRDANVRREQQGRLLLLLVQKLGAAPKGAGWSRLG